MQGFILARLFYLEEKMKKLFLALMLLAGFAHAGDYTTNAGLYKPDDGDSN